jgi:hypothetical protein
MVRLARPVKKGYSGPLMPIVAQILLPALSVSSLVFFAGDPVPFSFLSSCVFPSVVIAPSFFVLRMQINEIPVPSQEIPRNWTWLSTLFHIDPYDNFSYIRHENLWENW